MLLPDFAVGSYESDEAVVLYTRPVVYLSTTMTFYPKQVNNRSKKLSRSTFYPKRLPLVTYEFVAINIFLTSFKPIYQKHMP